MPGAGVQGEWGTGLAECGLPLPLPPAACLSERPAASEGSPPLFTACSWQEGPRGPLEYFHCLCRCGIPSSPNPWDLGSLSWSRAIYSSPCLGVSGGLEGLTVATASRGCTQTTSW